jgi:hypothetical protein
MPPSPDGGMGACQPGDETDTSSGDCVKQACVNGELTQVADDDDVPDDGNDCTVDTCASSAPKHENKPAGETCGMASSCDGMGACTCDSPDDCGMNTECQTWQCNTGVCASENAPQGTPLLQSAQTVGDCKVMQCNGNGGTEEVLDPTDPTVDSDDCTQDVCDKAMTTHPPADTTTSCATQDNPSGFGKCDGAGTCLGCMQTFDCGNGYSCATNVCFSCGDGMTNGTETDEDCGGECDKCGNGFACLVDADCNSSACDPTTLKCVTCNDGAQNGSETAVDCGGQCPDKCTTGEGCNNGGDCQSQVCTGGMCAAPTCTDTKANGNETDVDCGGPDCLDCKTGQKCAGNNDCEANCVSGICD